MMHELGDALQYIAVPDEYINIDNFIRLTEQLNDIPVKDEESLEYMGDITPGVIMPDDLPSPLEPGEDGNGSDDKGPFDGWD